MKQCKGTVGICRWTVVALGAGLGAMLLSGPEALALAPWTNYFEGFETGNGGFWGTTAQEASGTYGIPAAWGNYYALVTPSGGSYPGGINVNKSPTNWAAAVEFPGVLTAKVDLYLDMNSGTTGQQWVWFFADCYPNGADSDQRALFATKSASGWSMFFGNYFGASSSVTLTNTGWYTYQTMYYGDGFGYMADQSRLTRKSDGATMLVGGSDFYGYPARAITNFSGWVQTGFEAMDNIQNPTAGYSGVAFDNVSMVPEPQALGLMAIGGLLCFRKFRGKSERV